MPCVVSCAHCYHMFVPRDNLRHCPVCAQAMARIESECAALPDPPAARMAIAAALERIKHNSRLKRREFPPTNLRDLVVWLQEHPHVRITGPTPQSSEIVSRNEAFIGMEDGELWFANLGTGFGTCIPIVCVLTEAAASSETGIEFDDLGFTITKFDVPIRVEYQP